MEPVTIQDLLAAAAEGKGRIVSSIDLTPAQVEAADKRGHYAVTQTGLGWVLLPWEKRAARDAGREGAANPVQFAN